MMGGSLRRLAFAAALSASASAQFPILDSVIPRGGQRGTEIDVVLRGKKLGGARALLFGPGGIEVLSLEVVKDGQLAVRLAIAPDAELGPRAVWVRTAAGLTNLHTFHVGALAELVEVEPNGTMEEAQAIGLEVTLNGVAENEDVDYFAFDGRQGDRISIEIEGQRLGDRLFDPAVALFDKAGFALASRDDSALGRQDPSLSVVIPADGRYVIQVRESAYRGAGDCRYRLHVGRFPRPLATLPLGGRPGEELSLRLLAEDGDLGEMTVRVPELRAKGGWVPEGIAPLAFVGETGEAPSPGWLRVVDLDNVLEVEPNDVLEEATPFSVPTALNGVLEKVGDVDRYVFETKKGQKVEIIAFARRLRTPVDVVLMVQEMDGKTIANNDDDGGPDGRISFKPPHDGKFQVVVVDHLRRGGPAFAYRVEIAPVRPSLSVGIGGERKQVAIPQGGRVSVNFAVTRNSFGGPVGVSIEGLPAGVTATIPELPNGVAQVPVLFEATADAQPAHALCEVRAEHTDPEKGIKGGLREDIELVLGRNKVVFWAHSIDRLPIAVCDPAPFRVRVETPKVPLVRNGLLPVEVIVERDEGFEGPVALKLAYLPPGVSANRQQEVPAGSDRARFNLSAGGDARLGTWQMLVSAEAETPGGRVRVASLHFPIEIENRFVRFEVQPVAVDRGEVTEMFVEVKQLDGFRGKATVQLVGLPHEVSSEAQVLDAETETLVFPLRTGDASPVGKHTTLQFQAHFALEGGEVLQALAAAELRIQKPAPAPAPAKPVVVEAAAKVKPKKTRPPTRLEKLRSEHAARAAGRDRPKEDSKAEPEKVTKEGGQV
jgi:hypothetical protein